MSSADKDRLDRELDAVLGTLAGGEGPADMRSRVLARLARPEARPAPWRAWAAAAALIVVAAAGWRTWRDRPLQPSRTTADRPLPIASPSVVPPPASDSSPKPGVAVVAGTAPGPRRAAAATPADDATTLPPLPVPEPITVATLEAPGVELEPLDLKPLVVPDLAVTPLEDSGEPEHERKD
jgi:hypothetical protein